MGVYSKNITSELKLSTKLAIPLIASEIVYALSSFVATMMIAHLGKEYLAANALVWSTYIAVIMFFIGILGSVSTMVSQSFGIKDNNGIGICFKQGIIMTAMFTLPMMCIMWCAPLTLTMFKQDASVCLIAKSFFHALAWTILPMHIIIVVQQFLIGITKTKPVMVMSIVTVFLEIGFYYAFLFGKFGLPQIGLSGIGYGLAISCYIITACFFCYLYFSKPFKFYNLFKKWWVIEHKFLSEMFYIGVPLGFTWSSELIFFAVVAIMMGSINVTVLAAYQIANQYLIIAIFIIYALSQNVTVRMGNEICNNDCDKLKLIVVANLILCFIAVSIFSIIYIAFPSIATDLDLGTNLERDKELIAETMRVLPMVGIFLITDCIRVILNGALRALKDSKAQMNISLLGTWLIAFPASYIMAFKFHLGSIGIWSGIIIGFFITGIMLLLRFIWLMKNIKLESLITK